MLRKILWTFVIILVISQFFKPDKNESDAHWETDFILVEKPPQEIAELLKTSCYDCHSNNTKYPWYNKITPVNYWMADHVKHGKGHLNFSEWDAYTAKKKDHKLEEIIEEVKEHAMPLPSYLWMHKEAKLSDGQIKTLLNWVDTQRVRYKLANTPH